MLMLLTGPLASQTAWWVDLNSSTGESSLGCRPITLCFDMQQAWLDEDPMTGIVLDLFLMNGKFSVVDNPHGFVDQESVVLIPEPSGLLYETWSLEDVEIPSIDDGGEATICLTVVQELPTSDPDPKFFYRATYGSEVIGIYNGPALNLDVTFFEVGTSPSSETLLSEVEEDIIQRRDVMVQGTLVADKDFTFGDIYNFNMMEGSRIVVNEGVTLRFTGDAMLQGCVDPWDGIEVLKDGILVVDGSGYTPAKVLIQGADNAITARDGSNVFVKNALFRNNHVGILVPDKDVGKNDVILYYFNSDFLGTVHFPGQLAVTGVRTHTMLGPIWSNTNTYTNLATGMEVSETNVLSLQDYFEKCSFAGISASGANHTLYQSGRGLQENKPTFVDCSIGIFANNTNIESMDNVMLGVGQGFVLRAGILQNAIIKENIIRASMAGIVFDQWRPMSEINVTDNKIYVDGDGTGGTGILCGQVSGNGSQASKFSGNEIEMENARFGIRMVDSRLVGIRQNSIHLENSGQQLYHGIQLEGSMFNFLFCNTVEGQGTSGEHDGIVFYQSPINTVRCNTVGNTRRGVLALGPNNGLRLWGNVFHAHHNAWQVGWPQQFGGFTGTQVHRGNRWEDSYAGAGAAHYGSVSEIDFSKIVYNPNDGSAYSSTDYPNGDLFDEDELGNAYQCSAEPAGCPPLLPGFQDELDEADKAVIRGEVVPDVFAQEQIWSTKRHLYRRLLRDTSMIVPHSEVDTFFTLESATTVGLFEQIARDLDGLFEPDSATGSKLVAYWDTIQARMGALMDIEGQLDDDPSPEEEEELLGLRDVASEDISVVTDSLDILGATLKSARMAGAGALLTANEAINVSEQYEKNQKDYNRIYLTLLANGIDTLTAGQQITLNDIAVQCPVEGGDAVFQARALLDPRQVFDDLASCQPPLPLRKPTGDEKLSFLAYPNPGSLHTMVEMEEPADGPGEIILMDVLGHRWLHQKFGKGDKLIALFLDGIPSGAYYLTVRTAQASSTRMFVHQK